MSDLATRVARWDEQFYADPSQHSPKVALKLTAMRERFVVQTGLLEAMTLAVKQTLDSEGVSVIQYPFYIAFGSELHRLKGQNVSGEGLATEAATLIGKWVARGLSQSVLEAVRTQVFDTAAPTP